MTLLSNLTKTVTNKSKRRGRGLGSGKGSKSGRGTTRHQKARTSIPLHFEGGQGRLVKKYPLLRGKSKNKSINQKPFIVKLSQLENFAELITVESLVKSGQFKDLTNDTPVKVLLDKEIKTAIKVQMPVSKSVKKEIEARGGSVV